MDGWDIALLVVAGYIAVTALVRFMLLQRGQMIEKLQQKVAAERRRKKLQSQKHSPQSKQESKSPEQAA